MELKAKSKHFKSIVRAEATTLFQTLDKIATESKVAKAKVSMKVTCR